MAFILLTKSLGLIFLKSDSEMISVNHYYVAGFYVNLATYLIESTVIVVYLTIKKITFTE